MASKTTIPHWAEGVREQLQAIAVLPDDYDGQGSRAPSPLALEQAELVLGGLIQIGAEPHRIAPTGNNSVVFGFYAGHRWAELECFGEEQLVASTQAARGAEPEIWELPAEAGAIRGALNRLLAFVQS